MQPIIDFRVRPSTSQMIEAASTTALTDILKWAGFSPKVETLEELLVQMDRVNITIAVVQGRDIETTFDWRVPNEHVAEIVRAHPDRFIGFGGVDPNKGMDAVREAVKCVKELGLRGISIDPFMHKAPANDRIYYPLYSKCQEMDVIMNITTGPGPLVPGTVMSDASPIVIDEVARDFPDLKIVVSHGGYPWVTQMIALALRHRNLYFECSSYEDMPGSEAYIDAANRFVSKKMLYASAHPFFNFNDRLKIYEKLPFAPDVRRRVMYENAAELLGVTRQP